MVAPGFVDTDILAGDSPQKRASREQEVPLKRNWNSKKILPELFHSWSETNLVTLRGQFHVNGGLYLPK